jgi:uncharacterized protein (UPF0261 family)
MDYPTLDDLKAWLSVSDDQDDVVLKESLDAAIEAQCRVVRYPCDAFGDPTVTSDLRNAIFLRAQRYAARRNSPEGIIGIGGSGGDFVAARVASFDTDVLHLEGPHRKIPVA